MFFGLWPQERAALALHSWATGAQAQTGGRVTRAATIHLTLAFIGAVAAERVAALAECGREVRGRAFEMRVDECRWWKHNRIVWAGPMQLPEPLRDLAAQLAAGLEGAGFPVEKREFKAHVTLIRRAELANGQLLPPIEAVEWRGEEFVLVRSVLGPQGPSYEVLQRFALA